MCSSNPVDDDDQHRLKEDGNSRTTMKRGLWRLSGDEMSKRTKAVLFIRWTTTTTSSQNTFRKGNGFMDLKSAMRTLHDIE